MKIFYSRSSKSEEGELKRKAHIAIECLMLVFVMSAFGALLFIQDLRKNVQSTEAISVSNNAVFEMIGLDFKVENETEKLANEYIQSNGEKPIFLELFRENQRKNNG